MHTACHGSLERETVDISARGRIVRRTSAPGRNAVLPILDWRTVGLALLLVPSVILSGVLIAVMLADRSVPFDWWTFVHADEWWYQWGPPSPGGEAYSYRYSPLFAVAFPEWLGLWGWRALHVAVLLTLPRRLTLLMLAFAPFWYDVLHGNVMTFTAVAGYHALAGSRWGTLACFGLTLLVPRPVMLPLVAWIVWRRPEWRLPALAFAAVGLLTLAVPGYLAALLRSGGVTSTDNLGPSALFGWAWVPVGLTLAMWLTWRGRVGLAGLAMSPYVLPYYLLMLLIELAPDQRITRARMS